jgi:signal transduction histidine kinase/CheY-like chemotaxis protein
MATATLNSTQDKQLQTDEKNRIVSEKTLATGADYFEVLPRATDDAIRDWNVSSGAVHWPRGLKLLGHSDSANTGTIDFWFGCLHPDDLARVESSLKQAFSSSSERWIGEYRFRGADGKYLYILERALIQRRADGKPHRLVGALMDVTERQELQAQTCRSQRMEAFGQLAGGVAHDFNNFLTTILGYSDLLLSEMAVKGAIATQIREIREAAGRASTLTNQLLAFSRRQALEPAVLEVNGFIGNIERTLLRLLGDDIAVVCNLQRLTQGLHIKVDPGQLTQILVNLAINARDAMPTGGRLTISSAVSREIPASRDAGAPAELPAGEYVVISVSDNGVGMTEQVKARLFEPFFTTKEKARNSGLGLATSYGIVRQSGGQIMVESELGHGSTFQIYLPRVASPPAPAYRRPGHRKTGSETILVLEDEAGVRHLSVRVLRSLGYKVLEAAHGEDAKRMITGTNAPKIDLVLTDMVMPEISGRHFADWLRTTRPETKVIFISGYLEESLHPLDRRSPEMHFLAKPFSAEQLGHKVREVLDGKG